MSGHLRAFHQRFEEPSGSEIAWFHGHRRDVSADPSLVRERSITGAIRSALEFLLRWAARLLLISPVLILPKLLMPRALSDAVTVGFVLGVVTFFAILALYFAVSIVWWVVHRGRPSLRWAPVDLTADERTAAIALDVGVAPGTRVRATGRVVPLTETDVVLRAFASDSSVPWRLVELADFAVVPNDGVPLIARFLQAPALTPPGQWSSFVDHAAGFSAHARQLTEGAEGDGHYIELRTGQRVEIAGTVDRAIPNADSFDLDGVAASLPKELALGEAAYRRGPATAALVVGTESAPRIFIRRLTEG